MTTKNTGATLEALVRKRLADYKAEGLALEQNSQRFAGKVGPRGQAKGPPAFRPNLRTGSAEKKELKLPARFIENYIARLFA